MINLKDNTLSFTFPEIAQGVRAHFERALLGALSFCGEDRGGKDQRRLG